MSKLNVTSEKSIAQNKLNAIEKSKNAIKGQKMSNEKLLAIDLNALDLSNLKDLVKSNIKTKEVGERFNMYRFERENLSKEDAKKKRTKIRNERNKICDNILSSFVNDDATKLLNHLKHFETFYKDVYQLNDYSITSICQNNADDDTKVKLNFMLKIIKDSKVTPTKKVVKKKNVITEKQIEKIVDDSKKEIEPTK